MGIFRIASNLVAAARQESQNASPSPVSTLNENQNPDPAPPAALPPWLRSGTVGLSRAAARFGSSAAYTGISSDEQVRRARQEWRAVGRNLWEQLEPGGNFQPYWDQTLRTGAEVDVMGSLEESVNETEVLLSSLNILVRWGGAGTASQRELLDYRSRLSETLAAEGMQNSPELEDEILRWFPSYLQNLAPDDAPGRWSRQYPNPLNHAAEILAAQDPEEISTRDVAAFSMLIAMAPHFQTTTLHQEILNGLTGDGHPDLEAAAQSYRNAVRGYLTRSLEIAYGREALEAGLPPQNAEGGLSGMALPNYQQRPVAEGFERFIRSQPENLSELLGDFGHLEATIASVQGLNSIWDAEETIGQFDPSRIGFLDDWFLADSEIERLRVFSDEAQSRAASLEDGLAILNSAASDSWGRQTALRRFEEHRRDWEDRLGTEEAFFDQLGHQVQDISQMNQGRDAMGALLETGVLSLATMGAGSLLNLAGRLGRTARNLEAGTTAVEGAAGIGSAGNAALSTLREAAIFESASLVWDSQVDPGRRVSTENGTGEDLGRNAVRFFQTLGLFGTMNAVHRPFQRALRGIENLLGSTPSLRGNLALRTREGLLRVSESLAEVGGNAAYQTLFDSTFGQLRGLWGDPTYSIDESLAHYFNPQNLAMTLPMTGINNFLSWAGRRLFRRNPVAPEVPGGKVEPSLVAPASSDPLSWMRDSLAPNQRVRINQEEWVNILRVEDDYLIYRVNGRDEQGRPVRMEMPCEITPELLRDNFMELPLLQIRPTENGLSPYRLQSARDYLSEPVLLTPQIDLSGQVVYYAVDGHHRLYDAYQDGHPTARVRLTDTDPAALEIRMLGREGFPVPPSIDLLQIDSARLDGHEGDLGLPAQRRRALIEAGLNPSQLSETQLAEAYQWLVLNGVIREEGAQRITSRLITEDERHWLSTELPPNWDVETVRGMFSP